MKRSREDEEDSDPPTPYTDGTPEAGTRESTSEPAAKIVELDPSSNSSASSVEMRCSLPPHREVLVFKTYGDFESHYSKEHSHRCFDCRKNFPSGHLLNLHHEESHDPLIALKREKGEHTYSCFVEGCERKCLTPQKRRRHLIDKHMYPKNFFFAVTRDGVDGRRSMLLEGGHRRRRSSLDMKHVRRNSLIEAGKAKPEASHDEGKEMMPEERPDVDMDRGSSKSKDESAASVKHEGRTGAASGRPDVDMDNLTGAMSSLQFVPRSVRFGRGGRAGFAKS
ncbi:hypothetical protein GE09DRAFT_1103667 [Coniochaeta sp. 2T2.1]|nr:hypothetical protein GE09DRAFT_1103667 [Coniochaeta sp. 2T2.1]